MAAPKLDLAAARAAFPALAGDRVYLDNAGGSQTLGAVADRVRDYLLTTNVQLGATYAASREADERVRAGERSLARLVNAADPSEVVVGPSTSSLIRTLAGCLARTMEPGDEIVVTDCDHEANIGPWTELERHGLRIRTWNLDRGTMNLETADLERLLTDRTRLVAVTHVSNVLGAVNPVADWARIVHGRGARLCVDGVAYAPHRRVDVQAWDVDFYVLSLYKVYGPHLAVLYGKRDVLEGLPGTNHYFVGRDEVPYKFQPGSVNYELTWGAGAITGYLEGLGGGGLDEAYARIARHEHALGARLLDFLAGRPNVRVIGRPEMTDTRVPTVSFVVEGAKSSEIPPHTDRAGIGIRWGDFYARRLIERLGLAGRDGVVRVSAVHYNTPEEIDRLCEVLDPVL